MEKRTAMFAPSVLLALLCCFAQGGFAQTSPATPALYPLTVAVGAPLHIALTKRVPVKHAGVPVEGKVVENVYVFDHLVIPAGSRVMGKVTKVDSAPRKERALAIANGDFTPLRHAQVDFNTLVEADGKRIPLQTNVSQGSPSLVHMVAGGNEKKKKGRVASKVEEVHQQVLNQEEAAINNVTAPGKVQRLKAALSARLPYHRPSLPVGTNFTAELKTPLTFGTETPPPQELEKMGGAIPPGSLVHVRLVSPLSSATDHRDTPVRAVVSQPLFSSDHTLILPEGARLTGTINEAVPARLFGRNGQLRFTFRQLELTPGATRKVEASLQGIDADLGESLPARFRRRRPCCNAQDKLRHARHRRLPGGYFSGSRRRARNPRGRRRAKERTMVEQPSGVEQAWDLWAPWPACWRIPAPSARVLPSMARVGRSILTLWREAWTWSSPRTLPWRSALEPTTAQHRRLQAITSFRRLPNPTRSLDRPLPFPCLPGSRIPFATFPNVLPHGAPVSPSPVQVLAWRCRLNRWEH